MRYRDIIPRNISVLSTWREAACAMLWEKEFSLAPLQGTVAGTGEIGAIGASSALILWHKVAESDVVARLRDAASAMLLWREHYLPSEPHQELIPWVAWFRQVQARHPEWEVAWPEEEHLHP